MARFDKPIFAAVVLPLLISIMNLRVLAAPSELFYDSGRCDYGWSDFYPSAAAVRFSPPSTGWRLKSIRFYGACFLRGPEGHFLVEICDQNLNVVYESPYAFYSTFEGKNATLEWHELEIPDLVVGGDFYVIIAPSLTLEGPRSGSGRPKSADR